MATYQTQVESYIGPFASVDALSQFLTQGAKRVVDLLPEDQARKLSIELDVDDGGSDVSNLRIISVSGAGYPARPVPVEMITQLADPDSIYLVAEKDPVTYTKNQAIFVLPAGATNRMQAVAYPEVLYTDEDILGGTREYDELVVLYAAIQCRTKQFETARGLLPTAPTAPDITDELAAIEFQLTANEDIELAQGYMADIQTQLAAYSQDLNKYGIEMQAALHQLTFYQTSMSSLQSQYAAALQLKFGVKSNDSK